MSNSGSKWIPSLPCLSGRTGPKRAEEKHGGAAETVKGMRESLPP